LKWFKHISTSLDDPFIQDLLDEFGSDGYLVFFGILEMMAREFDIKSPGKVTLSRNYCRRKLRLSWHKCSTILKFCENEGRFFVSENGRRVTINCPKLKDMSDTFTQRELRTAFEPPSGKSLLEVDIDIEEEGSSKQISSKLSAFKKKVVDEEVFYLTKKKRKLKGRRLEAFNRFWPAFNLPKGKAEATDAWLDIPQLTNTLVDEIVAAAVIEAKHRPGLIATGQRPKWAQGWLNAKRWEDAEPDEVSTSEDLICKECGNKAGSLIGGLCKECGDT